ncbi:hypothetical protein JJ502_09490 [Klebsiella pneumoniae]|nr:hypothetical protein JJ502_09490 [Klebsiella pneumoniae]
MASPLARVITNEIFRVPARRKRKVEVKPSDIPTFHYTAHLVRIFMKGDHSITSIEIG